MNLTDTAIIVVNFGSSALLGDNLVPLSSRHPDLHVVVVDNKTSDAENEAVRRLGVEHGWSIVSSETNLGFGGGMNLGVARAQELGAVRFVLLNPDAVLGADALGILVERSRAEPNALLSPRLLRPDGSVWFGGADLYLDDGRVRSRRRRVPGARVEPWLSGACLVVGDALWRAVGGFDDAYFLYWEDIDLSHRMIAAGATLEVVEEAVATHAQGGTQGSGAQSSGAAKSFVYYRFNIRNRFLFAARHLDEASIAGWRRTSLAIAREVVLQGGRKQLLTRPSTVLVAWRALREGQRILTRELRVRRTLDGADRLD